MAQRMDVRVGMSVKSRDGRPLGRVIGLLEDAFLVEKGVFFAWDYRVPFLSVDTIHEEQILLRLDKSELQKADVGDVLEANHRMEELEPQRFVEARMDTARFIGHEKRRERATADADARMGSGELAVPSPS